MRKKLELFAASVPGRSWGPAHPSGFRKYVNLRMLYETKSLSSFNGFRIPIELLPLYETDSAKAGKGFRILIESPPLYETAPSLILDAVSYRYIILLYPIRY